MQYVLTFPGHQCQSSSSSLTPTEREIVKSYGGWTNSMYSYMLKPGNDDDDFEKKQIVERLAAQS